MSVRPGRRRWFAYAPAAVVLVLILGACVAARAAGDVQIVPAAAAGAGTACFDVRVTGAPVVLVIEGDIAQAVLAGGSGSAQVGTRITYGAVPLGHGVPSFALDPSPQPRRLCVEGRAVRFATIPQSEPLREALLAGRFSGFYSGFIGAIAILQLMLIGVNRERASLYYLMFLITLLGVEAVREGLTIVPGMPLSTAYVFWDSACAFAITAFIIEFLDLRRSAPRLFWVLVASVVCLVANAVAGLAVPAFAARVAQSLLISNAAGMFLFIAVSVMRARAGYRPAYYLLAGLGGLALQNWYLLLRDWFAFSTPLIDRWAFEAGSAADAMLFLLAIVLRMRDNRRAQKRIERELRDATFAACHDPLTALLNRRGLDRWVAAAPARERVVFFIDLDRFKAVNDRGGHHAGDLALVAVAAILAALTRADDVAARVGGDEFVLVIAATTAERIAELIARIQTRVAALQPLADPTIRIGASVGAARLGPRQAFDDALRAADAEAYRMKLEHHRLEGNSGSAAPGASAE
jgi:diguanylate cyclase (GGDEF)-like protein